MNYIVSALIITFIIPALGLVMGMVKKIIYKTTYQIKTISYIRRMELCNL